MIDENVEYRYRINEDIDETTAEEDFAEFIPKQSNKIIPNVRTNKITNHLHLTAKVQRTVTHKDFVNPEDNYKIVKDVNVGGKNNKVLVGLNVKYDVEDLGLTPFDLYVHNYVCNYVYNDQTIFTSTMIARDMIGQEKDLKSRTKLVEDIENSLLKMRLTTIEIDHTEQAIKHAKVLDGKDVKSSIIGDYMISLSYKKDVLLNGGKTTKAMTFQVKEIPPLFEYAQLYNQLATVDLKRIDTSKPIKYGKKVVSIRHDERVMTLKFELIGLIEAFKNKKNNVKSSEVKFKTLFERVELIDEYNNKKQRYNLTKHIEKLLTAFAENNYIKGFEFLGNSLTGKIVIKV